MKKIVVAILFCSISLCLWSAESEQTELRRALDQKCEQARAAKLRPIQQQKIEECIAEPAADRGEKKTREQCEAYWRDYGWGHPTAPGRRKPGMYEEIPECVAAFNARKSEER